LEGIESEAFDTVIINSVAQYFPDADYLARVLEQAVNSVRAGGSVFVGDVRSLRLLEAFHTSVELSRAPSEMSAEELRRRVRQQVLKERELCLDPSFFEALARRLPGVSRVEIQLKRGRYDNELTRFRYDVVLHVGEGTPSVDATGEPAASLDWAGQSLTLASVRRRLLEEMPESLLVRRVPNARLLPSVKGVKMLAGAGEGATVAELREAVAATSTVVGVEPEEVWALVDGTPYTAEVVWGEAGAEDTFNLVFRREGMAAGRPVVAASAKQGGAIDLSVYANSPLRGVLTGSIEPRLRSYLAERLPSYMIPSAFVLLDEMPLTPNGKVDRRALSDIEPGSTTAEESYVAPRTETEEVIASLWGEVLGLSRVGVRSDFFTLGGHSLRATQIISRLHRAFGVELPLRTLFESPTVEALARRVAEASEGSTRATELPEIERVEREGRLPLSFAQQRLWFIHQMEPSSASYNIPAAVRLRGELDVAALEQTLGEVVRRHEALRTTFSVEDG
ncbi:MAG TPA: phosphopantetheine-binding protein, partial [Pyrinomonadaceae bacterium]